MHHRENNMVKGRYLIGARNPQEAEQFLRDLLGKHVKVKTYYEDPNVSMPHGTVIRDC